MVKLGYDSYLKIAKEGAWGDGASPAVSVPILNDNFQPKVEMKERASELAASRFPPAPFTGRQWTEGGFTMNAYPDLIGYFLLAMLGTPSANNVDTGVWDNTFEPGVALSDSLSLEYSKAGVNPLMIAGFMVNQLVWTQGIEGEAQMLQLGLTGGGKFGTEGSPTSFTHPSTVPLQFDEAVMTVDTGSPVTTYLDSITWTDTNGLTIPYHKISGGIETQQPVLGARYTGEGSFVLDFENLTNWDRFRQATDVSIVITYTTTQVIETGYYYTLTVTIPKVRFQYPLPDIGGPDIAKETIAFNMFAGTVGASTVPISYTLRCGTDFSA